MLVFGGKEFFPALKWSKLLGNTKPKDAILSTYRWVTRCAVPQKNPGMLIEMNLIP